MQFELRCIKDKSTKCFKLELFSELEKDPDIEMKAYIKGIMDNGKRLKFTNSCCL